MSEGDRHAEPASVDQPSGTTNPLLMAAGWLGAIVLCVAFAAGSMWLIGGLAKIDLPDFRESLRAGDEDLVLVVVEPLPGAPPTPTATPGETTGVAPTWRQRPVGEFPALAQRKGVESGSVELQCPVGPDGRIASCWILNETPTGAGFAQAALIGAVNARLEPRTADGVPTEAMIRFTTRFKLE